MKQPRDHQQSKAKQKARTKKAAETVGGALRLFAGNMAFTTFRSNQADQTQHWLSNMDDEQLLQLSSDLDGFQDKLVSFMNNRGLSEPKEEDHSDV